MKKNKNAFFLFACFGAFLTACEKEPIKISKESTFDTVFKSNVNQQVLLTNDQSHIVLEVKSITDNRCKEQHEFCDNPGNATVRFSLSNMTNSRAESLLHLGLFDEEQKDIDSVMIKLDGHAYLVTLQNVMRDSSVDAEMESAEFYVRNK